MCLRRHIWCQRGKHTAVDNGHHSVPHVESTASQHSDSKRLLHQCKQCKRADGIQRAVIPTAPCCCSSGIGHMKVPPCRRSPRTLDQSSARVVGRHPPEKALRAGLVEFLGENHGLSFGTCLSHCRHYLIQTKQHQISKILLLQ